MEVNEITKMTSFSEYFWGEKNNGFDVLYHNMKHGIDSSKEFSDFLRESCTVEETYVKALAKLARTANNCGSKGSFGPFWQVLKSLAEKLSNIHQQLVFAWQELMKDVQKYGDEQNKKAKTVKDQESGTLETVHSIQQTIVSLQKAKESYHARCMEYEKLKRDSASQRDIEKAETKFKKANDDYRQLVEKYANVRNDFETKMLDSCKRFQEAEENHLKQMKEFVNTYAKAWENQHAMIGQVHEEVRASSSHLTVDKLIHLLIKSKTTGQEKPGPIEFEEADLSNLAPPISTPDVDKKDFPVIEKPKKEGGDSSSQGSPESGSKSGPASLLDRTLPLRSSAGWFLTRGRKKKKKDKEKPKGEENKEKSQEPRVDEEGFSIRPENAIPNHDSSVSSSDSDSDDDDDRRNKNSRIQVKINPQDKATPTYNVDDIKKSIEGLRLSPTPTRRQTPTNDPSMKSVAKPSQDLLGLEIFGNAQPYSSSTPTGGNYSFPRDSSILSSGSTMTTPVSTPLDDYSPGGSSFGARSDTPPVLNKLRSQTPTGTLSAAPLLPGPPGGTGRLSQRGTNLPTAMPRPPGRQSPAFSSSNAIIATSTSSSNRMERADSVPSLSNMPFNSSTSWSSRGPSPLTIGMSDSIPLAVAFSENVSALFKGTEESKCCVKLTGDMMVSFPAGIVRVLMDNPSPATLSFRIKNTSSLEHILVNKQLIIEDSLQSGMDNKAYMFNMTALTDHLRRQADQNKAASYFNIDILKYQVRTKPGTESVPLHLVSYWKCDATQTDFRLDYKYCGAAISCRCPLSDVTVMVLVDGAVSSMQSVPSGTWNADSKRAVWKLGDVWDMNENGGQGSIRAKFDVSGGPSTPKPAAVQFVSEGTSLAGIDFELIGSGYRLSLAKKRFITRKYISEGGGVEQKQV